MQKVNSWKVNYAISLVLILASIIDVNESIPLTQNIITISTIQSPILSKIVLKCRDITQVQFKLVQNISKSEHPYPLMLRLDYQPNKCLFGSQDLIIQQNRNLKVKFNKTCCGLDLQSDYQTVKIVATVRYAYILYGFPVSVMFIKSILPAISVMIASVLIWMILTSQCNQRRQKDEQKKQK